MFSLYHAVCCDILSLDLLSFLAPDLAIPVRAPELLLLRIRLYIYSQCVCVCVCVCVCGSITMSVKGGVCAYEAHEVK